MKEHDQKRSLSSLAPFLLFVIFTACILFVLLTGADLYQKFSKRDQSSFDHRTIVQYITTKIRQSDAADMIFVGNYDDPVSAFSGDTLFICEEIEGRTFYTRIYCSDDQMYELFSEKGLDFSMSSGQPIMALESLSFNMQNDLIYIDIEFSDHTCETVILSLRSGKEVANEK